MNGNEKKGFTLIETIVAVGVFVLVMITVVNIYLIYSRAQNLTRQRQNILNEAGFALEKIAQAVRLGEIIYFGYFDYDNDLKTAAAPIYSLDEELGISGKEIELALIDSAGRQVIYIFDNAGNRVCPEFTSPGIYRYTAGVCEPVFDNVNLKILDAGFYVSPPVNPYPDSDADCREGTVSQNSVFTGYYCACVNNNDCRSPTVCVNGFCAAYQQQPRVTVFVQVDDQSGASVNPYLLQTTASSRIYKR